MTLRLGYLRAADEPIVEKVRERCAEIAATGGNWTLDDAVQIAKWFNESDEPFDLFRFVDERTGDPSVGYKTKDGREWFYILRQMRNEVGSGLLETMMGPFDNHTADGRPVVRPDGPETVEGGLIGQQPY